MRRTCGNLIKTFQSEVELIFSSLWLSLSCKSSVLSRHSITSVGDLYTNQASPKKNSDKVLHSMVAPKNTFLEKDQDRNNFQAKLIRILLNFLQTTFSCRFLCTLTTSYTINFVETGLTKLLLYVKTLLKLTHVILS